MPSCELCGRGMKGRGRNIKIEGAMMLVCPQCAHKFGSSPEESKSTPSPRRRRTTSWTGSPASPSTSPRTPRRRPVRKKSKPRKRAATLDDMVLVEDYAKIIRNARQKAGMSQEELAQSIGERVTTLQSIEAGRLKPTTKTIRGLERELDISLLESIGTVPLKPSRSERRAGPTLGDRVVVKRKKSQKSD